jgi:hypothetical protein
VAAVAMAWCGLGEPAVTKPLNPSVPRALGIPLRELCVVPQRSSGRPVLLGCSALACPRCPLPGVLLPGRATPGTRREERNERRPRLPGGGGLAGQHRPRGVCGICLRGSGLRLLGVVSKKASAGAVAARRSSCLCSEVWRLQIMCSGALRDRSRLCPRSHGVPAAIGLPHRRQATWPAATIGAHCSRRRR